MAAILLTSDLMFSSRVAWAGQRVGIAVQTAMGEDALLEKAAAGAEVVILDLTTAGLDVIATAGAMDPVTVPRPDGPRAGRIRVERFVPQGAVLERAALVASHGGAGTVIAAGAVGVPQLMIPLGADQFDNARAFALQGEAARVVDIMVQAKHMAGLKAMMKMIGLDCGPCRLPLHTLNEQEYNALKTALDAEGFFEKWAMM